MLMSAELKGCITWFIHFFDLPYVRYNCAKFHHCRICVVNFREGVKKAPPYPWAAPKKPILNRVNDVCINHKSLIINEIFYLLKAFYLQYLSYLCMPFYFNYNVVFISRQETKLFKKLIFGTIKYLRTPKSCFSYNFSALFYSWNFFAVLPGVSYFVKVHGSYLF